MDVDPETSRIGLTITTFHFEPVGEICKANTKSIIAEVTTTITMGEICAANTKSTIREACLCIVHKYTRRVLPSNM